MVDDEQIRRIKCPYCGWIRKVPVSVLEDESAATIVRGFSEKLRAVGAKIAAARHSKNLDDPNDWIDMPKCPKPECGNVYQYNVRTNEVRK